MKKCNNELGELKGIIFIDTQRQQFDLKYPEAIHLDEETYNEFLHKYRRVLKIKRLLEKAKEDLKTIKYYI